ncbi:hypothetical protein LSCM4_06091 [Leishmania orientalis]|uniref:Uncharacterized protein n=1 Tax=Leishmania orientalis TaxID=2249476 RepID=A0A836HP19_9TRYP|nr:hypothetical protein LSCM4_06091 [Leishmania orientalis]
MSASSPSYREYRQALIELYEKYDPAKVSRVDGLLHRFAGHEEALVKAVVRKFCENTAPADHQASALHSAAFSQPPAGGEGTSFSGPPPHAPPDPADAMTSEAGGRGSHRTRPAHLYEAHVPLRTSQVPHEMAEYGELEEAYLRALEEELEEQPPAEAAEDSTVQPSMSATPFDVKTNLRGAHHTRANDSTGDEATEGRLLRTCETSVADRAPCARHQLHRYLGQEEEALHLTLARGDPGSVTRVANTDITSPALAASSKEDTRTAAANGADPPRTQSPSAPRALLATPQETEKAAEYAIDGAVAAGPKAATHPNQVEGPVRAQGEEGAPQLEGADAAATLAASQVTKAAAVVARITRHEGTAAGAGTSPTRRLKPAAAVSASVAPLSSGGARYASSPPGKRVAVIGVTSGIPSSVAVRQPLQAASARKAKVSTGVSRVSNVVLPALESAVTPSLILAEDEIDAALHSAIRQNALFDITFYDFFRVLGSSYDNGHERVSRLVANTLLGALFPDMPPATVRWEHADVSCAGEEEAGVLAEKMRERIVQCSARQLRSGVGISNLRVAQCTQSLVRRMADFVKTCRAAVLQLQRQPRPLFVGFWVHRSILPRAVPHWKRCWATTSAEGDAVSVCHAGTLKTELHIPFASVSRCYRETHAVCAPPAYTRNGLAFQLTTGTPPLLVVVCPESGDTTTKLLSAFRAWSSSPRTVQKRSTERLRASSPTSAFHSRIDAAESMKHVRADEVRVWVLERATSTYESQRWSVEGVSICMVSDRTRELCTCAVADVESVISEVELPVTPPARGAHGFMLCFGKGATPLMAFTEQRQQRTRLLDRLYRSRVLSEVVARETGK